MQIVKKPLLSNFQDYISKLPEDGFENQQSNISDEVVELVDVIPENVPNFNEFSSSSYVSGYFCRKILTKIQCTDCKQSLLADNHTSSHEIISLRDYSSDDRFLTFPSENFITSFHSFLIGADSILPFICMENNIKQNLLSQIEFNFNWFGCLQHKEYVLHYIQDIVSNFIIRNFCTKVNKILNGKTLHPVNPNIVEELALKARNKKKHDDRSK